MPCTILTARWQPNWPETISFHGMTVHRVAAPPPIHDTFKARWAAANYIRAITRWLRHNRDRYNLIFVSSLKHEAYAAMAAFGHKSRNRPVPIALRAERPGRDGDCLWQLDAPGGRRIKRCLMKADAFIAPSPQIHRELVAAGYARDRIHYLPHAVRRIDASVPKNERRKNARKVLAAASPTLQLHGWSPLAVFTGRLVNQNHLATLIAAWGAILARWPNARLWLAGDGPERAMLQAQIQNLNLGQQVLLAGTFEYVDELLSAADVFINPSPGEDLCVSVLEAMAAGLPVIVPNNRANRDLITHGQAGLLFEQKPSGGEYPTLAEAIIQLFDDPDLGRRLGETGLRLAAEQFDLANSTDSYISLFEELCNVSPE